MILFEWDETKAEINRRKHGIAFDDATQVFGDPNALTEEDYAGIDEARWRTIGFAESAILLFVAYTVSEDENADVVRIISARRATRKEIVRYGKNRQKNA
jgi:uncharacterized DUF497 family protein